MSTLPCDPAFSLITDRRQFGRHLVALGFAKICVERGLTLTIGILGLDLMLLWCGGDVFESFRGILGALLSFLPHSLFGGLIAWSNGILVALIAIPVCAIVVIHSHNVEGKKD